MYHNTKQTFKAEVCGEFQYIWNFYYLWKRVVTKRKRWRWCYLLSMIGLNIGLLLQIIT